jgi:hypothetical protein
MGLKTSNAYRIFCWGNLLKNSFRRLRRRWEGKENAFWEVSE